jgi:hypothetical protein
MRLDELNGVKGFYKKTLRELIKDLGLKKLGEGRAAEVFYSEKERVVYKFWVKDESYEKYVDYCKKHSDNPILPRFKSNIKELSAFFKRPVSFPDKIKYIKMELLDPISTNEQFPKTPVEVVEFFTICETRPGLKEVISYFENEYADILPEQQEMLEKYYEVFVDLKKIFNEENRLDIGSGNVMKRGSTLVITDPCLTLSTRRFNDLLRLELNSIEKFNDRPTVSGPARRPSDS